MAFIPTIGEMRMVIKFELVVKSSDDTGGQNEEYGEWFTTRGYLEKKRSFRDFQTGYDQSIKTYDLWVPWRNEFEQGVSKDVRVIFESRSFSIDTFEMVNEKRRLFHLELTEVR